MQEMRASSLLRHTWHAWRQRSCAIWQVRLRPKTQEIDKELWLCGWTHKAILTAWQLQKRLASTLASYNASCVPRRHSRICSHRPRIVPVSGGCRCWRHSRRVCCWHLYPPVPYRRPGFPAGSASLHVTAAGGAAAAAVRGNAQQVANLCQWTSAPKHAAAASGSLAPVRASRGPICRGTTSRKAPKNRQARKGASRVSMQMSSRIVKYHY